MNYYGVAVVSCYKQSPDLRIQFLTNIAMAVSMAVALLENALGSNSTRSNAKNITERGLGIQAPPT